MCELNPKHETFFRLEVFTSDPLNELTPERFEKEVSERVLKAEMALNADGRFRFHIHPASHENPDDSNRLDWLSAHLSYAMVNQGGYMRLLPNRGRGWEGDELRDAIDAAIAGRDLDEEREEQVVRDTIGKAQG